eukprot:TRINITY_DN541_c1_g2_i1.p1 TRINITY_DN541_c1_g2~~TRINITY_DN541_c1_g2_i1.p1  ORF type:complete len:636 (+),score=185.06 TRINITY_DN541_c1_g2_i1:62-1909(+)
MAMFGGVPANVILLKEGVDTSQGRGQVISNINACLAVVDLLRTTLGPRGMDKLISNGSTTTISNDGATIIQALEIEHPAARVLVDIAKSQDAEVGDGTTSVVVLAGELLKEAKQFVEDGVHPQVIIRAYRRACALAQQHLKTLAIPVTPHQRRSMLLRCAETSLHSKLIAHHGKFFAKMAVDAVLRVTPAGSAPETATDTESAAIIAQKPPAADGASPAAESSDVIPSGAQAARVADLDLIGIKRVGGGSSLDSQLVDGVAFKKTFSYAGFEMQPHSFDGVRILCLNVELELKAEKDNAEVRLKDPTQYQKIVDAEWEIIYEKLAACVATGANVVLSKLPIGDLATQYFADRDIFCAGRVPADDMKRTCIATGATLQSTCSGLTPQVMGSCEKFEETQVGAERYNFLLRCPNARSATIILRGGAEQFIEETARSLHDAMMIVKRALGDNTIVAGGGAVEMSIAKFLRQEAMRVPGTEQILMAGYGKALEIIPQQLAENAAFDSADILTRLRQAHHVATGRCTMGVDVAKEGLTDTLEAYVWEPALVRRNALHAATEAACLILSIDETVKNPGRVDPQDNRPARAPGGGMGMSQAGMGGMMKGAKGLKMYKGKGGK